MLTATEVDFIKDVIEQLSSIADPSEYTDREVEEAIEILDKLKPYSTEDFIGFTKAINNSLEGGNND